MKMFLIIVGVLLVAGIAFVQFNTTSGTWRYRITVEVETPEGLKVGSTVRQVSNSNSDYGIDLPDTGNPAEVSGEAVVVDLGDRGTLFALISDRSDQELYQAFSIKEASTVGGIKKLNSLQVGEKKPLSSPQFWPRFVTFTDMDAPKSVKAVPHDDLISTFGEGVTLKKITVEIVDERMTRGIVDKYLPVNFTEVIINRWRELSYSERARLGRLTTFKRGAAK